MISEKQLAANRRNAQLSTGPKTETGKEHSALNASRDPLTGQVHLMTNEDRAAFNAFSIRMTKDLDPRGEVELQLAQSFIKGTWRVNRLGAIEDNLFALGHGNNGARINHDHPQIHASLTAAVTYRAESKRLDSISLYEQRLKRGMQKDLATFRSLQTERKAREAKEMAEAELLLQLSAIENGVACESAPYDPAKDGFVFTTAQITTSIDRKYRLKEAYAAMNGPISSPPLAGTTRKPLTRAA